MLLKHILIKLAEHFEDQLQMEAQNIKNKQKAQDDHQKALTRRRDEMIKAHTSGKGKSQKA